MRKNQIVTLSQARRALPSLGESAACAQKLKAAIFEGIRESDMKEIMERLVKKAKQGDLAATKTLLDFLSKSAPTPQLSVGARLNVAARSPFNGHTTELEELEVDHSFEELRRLICVILRGDRLGKTADGILRLINQREGLAQVSPEMIMPALDGMLVRRDIVLQDGLYKLTGPMREE
jgi:hypothetical protein